MTRRKGRTLAQVEAERNQNERERQDYFRGLRAEEQRRDLEASQEAAQQILDDYRERRPAPPRVGDGREHSAIAPDSRLGYLRRNPQALPLVPLAPISQDLGEHPDATTYRESVNPATGEFNASNRRRDKRA